MPQHLESLPTEATAGAPSPDTTGVHTTSSYMKLFYHVPRSHQLPKGSRFSPAFVFVFYYWASELIHF